MAGLVQPLGKTGGGLASWMPSYGSFSSPTGGGKGAFQGLMSTGTNPNVRGFTGGIQNKTGNWSNWLGGASNIISGLADLGNVGLGIYNAMLSREALDSQKNWMNKQYGLMRAGFNSQIQTYNNALANAARVGSSLTGNSYLNPNTGLLAYNGDPNEAVTAEGKQQTQERSLQTV